MRSDCASRPTRGSKFVGLFSMTITNVLGSGLAEQPSAGMKTERTRNARSNKEHVDTAVLGCAFAALRRKALRSRIGDLSQDCGPLCSGRSWQVGRLMMPSLKS